MNTPADGSWNPRNRFCPVCGHAISIEYSEPEGDATCPRCGSLLWRRGIGQSRKEYLRTGIMDGLQGGMEALRSGNWPYAVAAYRTLVRLSPDRLMYRMTLRGAEKRLYEDNGSGKRYSEQLLAPLRSLIAEARASLDWDTVDRLAENGLEFNPWDIEMNVAVGDACEQRGFVDVAIFVLTDALLGDPSRSDLRKRLQALAPDDERFF